MTVAAVVWCRHQLVWRTSDWAVEAKVTKPFEESVKQESLFRRIR